MENQRYSNVLGTGTGNSSAPFLSSMLPLSSTIPKYHSSGYTYPVTGCSAGCYLGFTSGSDQGKSGGYCPTASSPCLNVPNIAGSMTAAGLTWAAFCEDSCTRGADHFPWIGYTNTWNSCVTSFSTCTGPNIYNTVSSNRSAFTSVTSAGNTQLISYLNSANPANYIWLTPNDNHNMHDDSIQTGDTYLRSLLIGTGTLANPASGSLLATSLFTNPLSKTMLYIWWDEYDPSPNLEYGLMIKAQYSSSSNNYDEYASLHTLESNWNLPTLVHDAQAPVMTDLFGARIPTTTSTSWNPKVQCTPLIVRITDITANQTGSASYSASPFSPGTTTTVSNGAAKRWLTPGSTPPGWVSPGPSCTSPRRASLLVEIDGIERDSVTSEDSASTYDATNGGTSHAATYDNTFNIFDPTILSNLSASCTSASDPTCYGRIHAEIDHDWLAAGYCGTGTTCDPSALASQTSYSSTKIDIQGFVNWDPDHLTTGWHSYNGWEIHSVTAWRLSGQQDFSISTNPSSVSFAAGTSGSFTTTVSSRNGFTGTVNLSTSTSPSGLTASCSPSSISGGSGTSTCTLNSSTQGSYTVTVTGTSGSLVHSTSVSISVTSPPDFTVSASPTTATVNPGVAGTSTITVAAIDGFNGTVTVAATTNSTGLSCTLLPTTLTGGSGTSTLSCTSSAAGNFLVTATGTSGALSHPATVTYHAQDFTISVNPTALVVNIGLAGTSSITVAPLNGFAGNVTLAVTTNSTSLLCTLSATNIPGGSGSATLSCTGSGAGNYLATVTGSSGSLVHSAAVAYNVKVVPDFTVTASPTSTALNTGVVGDSTITVAPVNGFTGTVSLVATMNSTNLACTLNPTSIPGGSGSATLSCNGSSAGNYLATVTATNGTLSHSATVKYDVQDFTLSASPTNVNVNVGAAGNSSITVSPLAGFTGTVALAVTTNSTNLSCTLYPTNIQGGSGTSSLSCTNSAAGNYLATVTSTNGTLSHVVTVTYHVTTLPVQDFTISTSQATVTVNVGVVGNSTITIASLNSFAGTVTLSVTSNSTNLVCTLSPATIIDGSGTSTLSCQGTTAGNYLATVTGTSGSLSHSATITYQAQDFTVVASPTSISTTVGVAGTSTISVALVNGFSGTVTLAVTTNSTRLSCSLSPTTSTGGSGNSTLTCSGSTAGNYLATVAGTSSSLLHSTSVIYDVSPAPDFSVSASPTSLSIVLGSSGTSTITLASLNGFSGSVGLAALISPTGPSTSFNPSTVTLAPGGAGNSTITVTSASSVPGTYKVNVTATAGSVSHSALVTVTVTSTSSSSNALVVTSDGYVYKLYPNNTLIRIGRPVTSQLNAVAWKPDRSYAVIVGNAAVLIKYDGTKMTIIPTSVSTSINFLSVAWKPDGSYVLIGGSAGMLLKYDGTTATKVSNPYSVSFQAISWNPGGTQALLVSNRGKIYLYQSTGQIIQLTSPTTQNLDAVAWNPNGSYALLAGSGGTILKYNGTGFQTLNTARVYSPSLTVRFISFNPTGSLALLVGDSGLVLTYNGANLSILVVLTSNTLYSVSWTNGTAYTVGGSGTLLAYSGGVLSKIPSGISSGFRGIAWKP